jgi:restriction endonuclease S subunit
MANVSSSNGLEKYPKLRFKDFSEPWNTVRIGDVYSERSERGAEDMELLSVTMNDGVKMRSDIEGKDNSSEDKSNYKIVRAGDMVYNSMRMWQGANGISPWDGIVSPAYTVLKPRIPISNGFFAALFKTHRLINEFRKNSQGMTSDTWNLKYPQIETIKTCIPALAEQEKIADFLMALDQRIEKQRTLVEHLKKYKRGLLSSLLDKEEWQTVLMQDVACGFDYGMNSAATEYDGKHKYIRITDIDESTHKYISTECVSPSDLPEAKYKVEENDILFARTGASVGKSYIYDSRDGDLYYAGFLIRASVKPDFNSYFVYLNTLTLGYQRWVVLESTRSGQPGINAEQYRNYKFKCPPIEIQNKIANIFIHFDLKLQREQEILYYLLNYKKAMMKNIFV